MGNSLPVQVATDMSYDDAITYFIYINKRGTLWSIQKGNLKYGSYDTIEKAKEVRAFLIMKNWDKKYSNKIVKLKGKEYRDWLFSEMEKEGVIINEQSDNIQ